ncbi:phasin family protein [Hugonella massiliensis]|uniref:phasin family protein n=1 Tax=Hugonella massiliensis TaxID=1720315 RepID=UPI00073E6E81|nr:hypothetical protein [Hugonella massiliensis]
MAIGDGFKNIFLAGIGALAITGEKSKELVDQLVEKGELTVEQGKAVNSELVHKASEATKPVRDAALEARMAAMAPEERAAFVAEATRIASEQNAKADEVVVDAEVVEEAPAAEAEDAKEAPEAK